MKGSTHLEEGAHNLSPAAIHHGSPMLFTVGLDGSPTVEWPTARDYLGSVCG